MVFDVISCLTLELFYLRNCNLIYAFCFELKSSNYYNQIKNIEQYSKIVSLAIVYLSSGKVALVELKICITALRKLALVMFEFEKL